MNLMKNPGSLQKYLSVDYLKNNHTKIHAFGLGFIQIKLGEVERVHVYTAKVSLTTTEEEIHNHRYNFTSTILKGTLKNKIYQVEANENGKFMLIDEACNPNVAKSDKKLRVNQPKLITEFNTGIGQSYHIDKDVFHQVEALEGTITLVERGPVVKSMAQIIYPEDISTTCPFSSNLPEEELWKIVKECL